jgi:hypothetical protein
MPGQCSRSVPRTVLSCPFYVVTPTRKNITLPDSLWQEIADYRFGECIGSEAEAVRRLIVAGLRAEKRKAAKP